MTYIVEMWKSFSPAEKTTTIISLVLGVPSLILTALGFLPESPPQRAPFVFVKEVNLESSEKEDNPNRLGYLRPVWENTSDIPTKNLIITQGRYVCIPKEMGGSIFPWNAFNDKIVNIRKELPITTYSMIPPHSTIKSPGRFSVGERNVIAAEYDVAQTYYVWWARYDDDQGYHHETRHCRQLASDGHNGKEITQPCPFFQCTDEECLTQKPQAVMTEEPICSFKPETFNMINPIFMSRLIPILIETKNERQLRLLEEEYNVQIDRNTGIARQR